jgi:hypothetical protein
MDTPRESEEAHRGPVAFAARDGGSMVGGGMERFYDYKGSQEH